MKYFSLYPQCYLVSGSKNLAIYDILQKRVFWVTEQNNVDFFLASQAGNSIESICEKNGTEEFFHYAELLQSLDLGAVYTQPVVSSKYRPFIHPYLEEKNGFYIPLSMVTLELASDCPRKCQFCESKNRFCSSECVCGSYSSCEKVDYDIEKTLEHLSHAKPGLIEIAGGDPFCNRDDLKKAVSCAFRVGIPIKVKSCGQLIEEDDILFLSRNEASLTLILPDFIAEPGSPDVLNLIRILNLAARHNFHKIGAALIYDETRFDNLDETRQWLKQIHIPVEAASICFSSDINSETESELNRHLAKYAPQNPTHFAVGINEAARGVRGNQCWSERLCIMANGEVRSCIAEIGAAFGNVNEENILNIIKNRPTHGDKRALKDSDCSHCEFSLGCFTCDVADEKMRRNQGEKSWNCLYKPSQGKFFEYSEL